MDGILLPLLVSYYCFIFIYVPSVFSLDHRNGDNGYYYRKKFMHLFLTPFTIMILYMEKLKQSNTCQYRYEQMIATNNARTREVCCQA